MQAQNALALDGVNDYVQTTFPGITGTSPRTVEAWIKTTANCNPSAGGIQQIITDWGVQATGTRFTFNVLWNNAIRVEVSGSGLSGTIPVNTGAWNHVAVVYNPTAANQLSLYVNGVLDVSGNISPPINTSSGNMRIGQRVDAQRHFDGTIDEVRVWNYAKTQAEIVSTLGNELCSPQAGLVAYYRFDQGTAGGANPGQNTLMDLSGNGYNGTLNNFALTGTGSNWVAGFPLTPGASSSATISDTSCTSYLSPSGNHLWHTSGTYTDTIPNAIGCDSLLTINLLSERSEDSITAQACDAFVSPSGNYTWTSSGTYRDTLSTWASSHTGPCSTC